MTRLRDVLAGRVSYVSEGDPVQDAQTERDLLKHSANMAEGLCPNGCAPLEAMYVDADIAEHFPEKRIGDKVEGAVRCPTCGFLGFGYSMEVVE